MKLTDTQLMLLSAASQREDHGIELGPNLKGGAAQKLVRKLLTESLIEEVRTVGSLPVWRRDDDNQSLALRITKHGLAAIQGGAHLEADEHGDTEQGDNLAPNKPSQRTAARRKRSRDKAVQQSATPSRRDSKQARVIEMLHRRQGTTVAAIMKATGWQPHSVRGFFTSVVRNKLGLTLVSEKNGGDRVYRIVAENTAPKRKGKSGRKAA